MRKPSATAKRIASKNGTNRRHRGGSSAISSRPSASSTISAANLDQGQRGGNPFFSNLLPRFSACPASCRDDAGHPACRGENLKDLADLGARMLGTEGAAQ